MSRPPEPVHDGDFEGFLERPTERLDYWTRVWEADVPFPTRTHRRGLVGTLLVAAKRLARLLQPIIRFPQADLWERQRAYNRILIDHLTELRGAVDDLSGDLDTVGSDLQQVQGEILRDIREIQREINATVRRLSDDLDDFRRKGMYDVMRHTDALFSRLDQKLDRLARSARYLRSAASPDAGGDQSPGGS